MKKYLFIIALVAVAFLSSCKKENQETKETKVTAADFAGTYKLSLAYTEVTEEEDPQTGSWNGTMTITATGENTVSVTSEIEIAAGTKLNLYNTTGAVNEKGELVLVDNTYSAGSREFTIEYDPIMCQEPLRFNSTLSIDVSGYMMVFEVSNVAVKQK